jgi:hypothetical protein
MGNQFTEYMASLPPLRKPTGELAGWDVTVDPFTHYIGWPTWRTESQVNFPPVEVTVSEAYAKAVQDFKAIFDECCALSDESQFLLGKRAHMHRLPSVDIVRAGIILDRVAELGPQYQPLLSAIFPMESQAIPEWYAYHKKALPSAYAKADKLRIEAEVAQQKAALAENVASGHQIALDWCRNNARTRGVKLPEGPVTVIPMTAKPGQVPPLPVLDLSNVSGG